MLRFSGRRESKKCKSIGSIAVAFALVLSSVSFLSASAVTPSSGVTFQPPQPPGPSLGSFTPDYYLLGQLKGATVDQTQRPRSLPLEGGYQFALDYYTPGDFQGAYGLTNFLSNGYGGRGETIAIIDAYGDPEIYQDVNAFDQGFGLPPVNLSIIPVGPYEPSLGITYGWDAEVALDVEAAHMMAPLANINLVVAPNASNGLFFAIKDVVTNHLGNVVSMSWGQPEDTYGLSGVSPQGILNYPYADYYFSLGASEGITFFSASGDYGAFDGTTSTTGSASFPATSPSVTAVGGTTLFVTPNSGTFSGLNSTAVYQEEAAWSISPQYIGEQVSSGGGYSSLFAKPSYQRGIVNGSARAIPDVAADSNPYTGMVVVLEGGLYVEGGTSLASAMWAGMGADIAQYVGHPLGALNPYIYSIYGDKSTYDGAFHQVISGFNGGSQAGPGYNMITGLGSPDVPALASAVKNLASGLSIRVGTNQNSPGSVPQYGYGSTLTVVAAVTDPFGETVSAGTFTADVEVVSGLVVNLPLSFNGSDWIASYQVATGAPPNTWTIMVSGSSAGATGQGFTDVDIGVNLALATPVAYPYAPPIPPNQPFPIKVLASNANGAPISDAVLTAHFIQGGRDVFEVPLSQTGVGEYSAKPKLAEGMPQGTYTLVVNGTGLGSVFEYVYFGEGVVGAMLTPVNDAIPSVSPGQSVTFIAAPLTSESTGAFTSNVTADVYTLGGELAASVDLQPAPNIVQFGVYDFFYYQQANFTMPTYLEPGFYRLEFVSTYDGNATTGLQLGTYTTGFYVSSSPVNYDLAITNVAFEGENLNLSARITNSTGDPVVSGVFNANVLPTQLTYAAAELGGMMLSGVPMQYNETLGEWSASYQIPSILTAPFYYGNDLAALAGSWTVFVSGESSNAESAVTEFAYANVLPYTLLTYSDLEPATVGTASLVTSNGTGYVLTNAGATHLTISGLTMTLGEDSIGRLTVVNAKVVIDGSKIASLNAIDSSVELVGDTQVGSLSLTGSTVAVNDSIYQAVSPALPSISVTGLSQTISNLANFTVTVTGQQLAAGSLSATIDGVEVPLTVTSITGGLSATANLNATKMSDGVHTLSVTVPQTDGLSVSLSTFFSTDAQSAALKGQLIALQSELSTLNSTVKSMDAQLKSATAEAANLTDVAYALAAFAVLSLAVAVYALRRRPAAVKTNAGQSEAPQSSSGNSI